MKKRLLYGLGVALLAVCVTLLVWQGSFSFGEYGPSSPDQTFLTAVKLYIERSNGREGSLIETAVAVRGWFRGATVAK